MYVSSPKYRIFGHWLFEVCTLETKNFASHFVFICKTFNPKPNISTKSRNLEILTFGFSCLHQQSPVCNQSVFNSLRSVWATSHFRLLFTISMLGQRATGKIQRNNYHHGSCGSSLTGKTMSVFLIFTQGTHWNVKSR